MTSARLVGSEQMGPACVGVWARTGRSSGAAILACPYSGWACADKENSSLVTACTARSCSHGRPCWCVQQCQAQGVQPHCTASSPVYSLGTASAALSSVMIRPVTTSNCLASERCLTADLPEHRAYVLPTSCVPCPCMLPPWPCGGLARPGTETPGQQHPLCHSPPAACTQAATFPARFIHSITWRHIPLPSASQGH